MSYAKIATTITALLYCFYAQAELSIIVAKPNRCITLNEGQTCYQDITINWQTLQPANYCITTDQDKKPLQCWENTKEANFIYSLASDKNLTIQLLNESKQIIATRVIEISWVYKNKRQATWRLF